jgi:DNA-binding NtrC family response regulator
MHHSVLPNPSASTSGPPFCLIVEDAALIGMALEGYLEEQGFACETAASADQGLALLEKHAPAVAILDYVLKDGPCTALAAALRARGVPFLIYSGYAPSPDPSDLDGTIWINKPATRETLVRAVMDLVPAARGASA